MPPIHRPFYDYWRQVETDATVKVKHHSPILWPFVNKDSLGKPTPLLLLLNSRGRHPPPFFIDTDSQYVQRAALADMLVDGPLFPTRGMQLILRSVSSGDVHGTLREVPKFARGTWLHLSTKDYDWPTSDIYGKKWLQNQFSTSFGMVILEIQERSMDFLVKCCHQILRHIEPDNLFSDVYPVQPEPELPLSTQTQGIQTSLLEITVEPLTVFRLGLTLPTLKSYLRPKSRLQRIMFGRCARIPINLWNNLAICTIMCNS